MATALPRLIVLGALYRYLQYETNEGQWHGRVRLTSLKAVSEKFFTKFAVVQGPGDTVQIQSCYNKKFLRLENDRANWFLAMADEPEEDRAKWSCTLFRPNYNRQSKVLTLSHLSQNAEHPVSISTDNNLIMVRNSSSPLNFQVIDMVYMIQLPRHVSFKGENGFYLSSRFVEDRNRLRFLAHSRYDPTVRHELTTMNNGWVQIWSKTFNDQLWRKSEEEAIWCDTTDVIDIDTMFEPIRRSDNWLNKECALLCISNNKYCVLWRGGDAHLSHSLTASASTIVNQVWMRVEETIRRRYISSIEYMISEARVYNVKPLVPPVPEKEVVNDSYTDTMTETVTFEYERVTRLTIASSHSWKIANYTNTDVSTKPKVVHGEVVLDDEFKGKVYVLSWDMFRDEEKEIVTPSVQVIVPPRTRAVVSLVVETANFDVPFSYQQRDELLDFTVDTNIFGDGLFTGFDSSNYHFDVQEEQLPDNNASRYDRKDEEPVVVRRRYAIRPLRSLPYNKVLAVSVLPSHDSQEEEVVVQEEATREAQVMMSSKL